MNKNDIVLLKSIALSQKIPIVTDEVINFIVSKITKNMIVLEIGSGIGYSTLVMSLYAKHVYTFEKDKQRFEYLQKNILDFKVDNVTPFFGDALSCDFSKEVDLIFIDAAKTKNIDFFIKYSKNIVKGGIIITDNIFLHNLEYSNASKRTKKMIQKIQEYVDYLSVNELFITQILNIGDGISYSIKK